MRRAFDNVDREIAGGTVGRKPSPRVAPTDTLTSLEEDIIALVVMGHGNKEIAFICSRMRPETSLSEIQANIFLGEIFRKMGVADRYELTVKVSQEPGKYGLGQEHMRMRSVAETLKQALLRVDNKAQAAQKTALTGRETEILNMIVEGIEPGGLIRSLESSAPQVAKTLFIMIKKFYKNSEARPDFPFEKTNIQNLANQKSPDTVLAYVMNETGLSSLTLVGHLVEMCRIYGNLPQPAAEPLAEATPG